MGSKTTSRRTLFKPNFFGPVARSRHRMGALSFIALVILTGTARAQSGQAGDTSLNFWAALGLISLVLLSGLLAQSSRKRMR